MNTSFILPVSFFQLIPSGWYACMFIVDGLPLLYHELLLLVYVKDALTRDRMSDNRRRGALSRRKYLNMSFTACAAVSFSLDMMLIL